MNLSAVKEKKMIRPNKRLVGEGIAAVLWCLLTLATDRLFFRYDWQNPAFFVYKALFVLLAFAVIHGAVTLVGNLRLYPPLAAMDAAVSGRQPGGAADRMAGVLGMR